ncbi:tRNA (N6-threonylcarbamoyladenosine(37)-N6)-methyltransferase TrmO [Bacillus pseudomycoides]|uniref:tRNA (N6-threonylcarbamoyladenosine(37)-N6)-methyltransferase TrmO n=1 Tax=Bacillus pseudomycoides TaxID=64104 RepID=UPI000BF18172|nr:tRNA (N6-threonylcarbamoyladenosine(37)-N6)-methyltransferase TrmO [Bacillus pseudomycoides]PEI84734.1 tRNA (N6-threonylcarbamoyladenosine(37)-N6)-methyltransferase TrmO [Bacillus pseudomycoides]
MSNINMLKIGEVHSSIDEKVYSNWGNVISNIRIYPEYIEGLIGLDEYSHATIIFYMNDFQEENDKSWIRRPRGLSDFDEKGCFAQRTKYRPNPIGITTVEILEIKNNIITVKGLDANDQTAILDVKPYIAAFDVRENVCVPNWMSELMKNYF